MADHYHTLTRTYRPRTFDDIVSQKHVSDTLKNAIKQNRLAHAYMFCGPRGVGKTTMARVLARTVNDIDNEVSGESLNQTLNVIEIDAASNNGVDDIRDLRERVRIPPQNGRFKIYIIDEVHMLSKAAFNALLKTLEEPPDHVIFIFATTEPQKVLPTILSRVQRFDFRRIGMDEIVSRLKDVAEKEDITIDNESLHVIAKKADGALRDALGLLDQAIAFCGTDIQHEELLQALNVVSVDRMFEFMDAVEGRDATEGLQLINNLLQEGYDIQEFIVGLTEHLRNLYVARQSANMYLIEASDAVKKRYRKGSKPFSEDDLMRMLHIVSEAQFKIKEAHQPKIQFEITLLKLIHMGRSQNLDALIEELNGLKKKITPEKKQVTQSSPAQKAENVSDQTKEYKSAENKSNKPAENAVQNSQPDDSSTSETEIEPENPISVSNNNEPEEISFNIFETPTLGNGTGQATETIAAARKDEKKESESDSGSREITLSLIKKRWDSYLLSLKEQVPTMIYFQMQRVEPVKLENRELLLRCSDHFAKKMVEEHKQVLQKTLKTTMGGFLQLRCVINKQEEKTKATKSPYERFKELQERDPKIKTLVELFGAELDYNLNR
jgi:DNA polymerase-3 subunit gamma/tau